MPTTNTEYRVRYTGNQTTGPFPITFDVTLDGSGDAENIKVYRSVDGGTQTEITSLCTVTGKNVTLDQEYDSTYTIIIEREPELKQTSSYDSGGDFPKAQYQDDLDGIYHIVQRVKGERNRSVRQGFVDTPDINDLPGKTERVNGVMAFDGASQPLGAAGVATGVSDAVAQVLDDATVSNARTTLGVYSKGEQYSQTELNSGGLDGRYHTESEVLTKFRSPNWGGSERTVLTTGIPYGVSAMTALSRTRFAIFDPYLAQLGAWDLQSDGTFTNTGTDAVITGAGLTAACALTGSTVAIADEGTEGLSTYSFDGSTWSQVGNTLTITGLLTPDLSALTSSRVALFDYSSPGALRVFEFDGTDWTEPYGAFTKSVGSPTRITALNSTDVAVVVCDVSAPTIETYRFDGSTWSKIGNTRSFPLSGFGASARVTAISPTDIVVVTSSSAVVYIYRFDGTDWDLVGDFLIGASAYRYYPGVVSLSGNMIVLFDSSAWQFVSAVLGWSYSSPYRPS